MQKLIGKYLKEKRAKQNKTQREVAENTGTSRSYIADLEAGRYMPSVKVLIKLALYLGMDLNFLLETTEKHYKKNGDETNASNHCQYKN